MSFFADSTINFYHFTIISNKIKSEVNHDVDEMRGQILLITLLTGILGISQNTIRTSLYLWYRQEITDLYEHLHIFPTTKIHTSLYSLAVALIV